MSQTLKKSAFYLMLSVGLITGKVNAQQPVGANALLSQHSVDENVTAGTQYDASWTPPPAAEPTSASKTASAPQPQRSGANLGDNNPWMLSFSGGLKKLLGKGDIESGKLNPTMTFRIETPHLWELFSLAVSAQDELKKPAENFQLQGGAPIEYNPNHNPGYNFYGGIVISKTIGANDILTFRPRAEFGITAETPNKSYLMTSFDNFDADSFNNQKIFGGYWNAGADLRINTSKYIALKLTAEYGQRIITASHFGTDSSGQLTGVNVGRSLVRAEFGLMVKIY